jgi:hypothetical protein
MGPVVKTFVVVVAVLACAGTSFAQGAQADEQLRNRVATMEAVLQRAVSAGAENLLRKVTDVIADQPSLSSHPAAYGFPLPGHGLFFYVQVPRLQMPILWSMRNLLGAPDNRETIMMVQQLQRTAAQLEGPEAEKLRAMARQLEMQLVSPQSRPGLGRVSAAAVVTESAAPSAAARAPEEPEVLTDPQSVYTREIKGALLQAMLENGQTLALASEEWLVVAARGDEPRNPLQPGDEGTTWMARVKGSDLAAIRAGTLTVDEARKRVQITEN